jgi:hypothetical protein
VAPAYTVGGGDRLEGEFGQGVDNVAGALDEVFTYERSEREELFGGVTILVNDLHLLDDC